MSNLSDYWNSMNRGLSNKLTQHANLVLTLRKLLFILSAYIIAPIKCNLKIAGSVQYLSPRRFPLQSHRHEYIALITCIVKPTEHYT